MKRAESLLEILKVPEQGAKISESAIVVVDAQREYRDGKLRLEGVDEALGEIGKLLERARSLSAPIFHIVHHAPGGAPIFDPEGPMSEIVDEVAPRNGEPILPKNLPSGFVGTDLNKLLQETGRSSLIITGFMTHMCVNATARSALDHGFQPTVIASCCATRDLPGSGGKGEVIPAAVVHASNLASLADLVSAVVDTVDSLDD